MDKKQVLSLANLDNGAAIERFDAELKKAIENIVDPNTEAKQVREVTLKIKIKPNTDRDFGSIEILTHAKLAPIRPEMTSVYIVQRGTENYATEFNPRQAKLDFPEEIENEKQY